jgi:hypothetical protein
MKSLVEAGRTDSHDSCLPTNGSAQTRSFYSIQILTFLSQILTARHGNPR